MLVQNYQISDPLILQQTFSHIISGDIIPTSSKGCPCAIGYRFLPPKLALIWGTYSYFSGAWHTQGGIYISISIDQTPFFFKGKKVSLLDNPLEVTLTYNHQEIDFSFTSPYQSLVLYVDTDFFKKIYQNLLQQPFEQTKQSNLVSFNNSEQKEALLKELLPLSYQAKQDNLSPQAGLEISESLIEGLIQGLKFESPSYLDRTTCQTLGLKAHEYLLSKPRERVSLSELSHHLQAPLRSIQKGFQELYGLSPIEYHQRFRLLQLRAHIHQHGRNNIGDTAKHFGFHHAGRLSKLYKEAFGVLPSHDHGLNSAAIVRNSLGVPHLPSFS